MHESPAPVRERARAAVHVSRVADALRPHARILITSLLAAGFLGAVGAFGSGSLPAAERYAYWLAVMVGGGLIAVAGSEIVFRSGWLESRPRLQYVLLAFLISLPQTLLVWAIGSPLFRQPLEPRHLIWYWPPVALVTAAMTAVNYLAARTPPMTHAPAEPARPSLPRFLERFPAKLRGAELYAVEAEDHYLRLHTSRGSDLILLRLADAVSELEGIEGAQTHRSWWVARNAVRSAERGDGRAVLTLANGAQAPVSRTYAKVLREAGWF